MSIGDYCTPRICLQVSRVPRLDFLALVNAGLPPRCASQTRLEKNAHNLFRSCGTFQSQRREGETFGRRRHIYNQSEP